MSRADSTIDQEQVGRFSKSANLEAESGKYAMPLGR